jgi:isochorismate synthase
MLSEHAALSSVDAPDYPFDPDNHALFVSGQTCHLAQHIQQRFTVPIADSDYLVAKVSDELAKCPSNNAVAFGVLPFCKTEQAQFIVSEQVQRFDRQIFTGYLQAAHSISGSPLPPLNRVQQRQSQAHYESAIAQAKELFARGQLEKIVLGKQVDLHFSAPLPKGQVLSHLLQQNHSGFPFSFPCQSGSTLIGVSPELLLRKQDHQIFSNPLAGSAKRVNDHLTDVQRQRALMASKKDRFEHAVVLDDMATVLTPFCDTFHIPAVPSLLPTATMWHLSSEVSGELKNPLTHVLALANRLHPTPALCGKPTDAAYPWVHLLEGESRHFFSGIVGWCDKHGNGEWVVVIRSAELHQQHARLFAGAGIVAASDPTLEWQETEAKLTTMLNALQANSRYHALFKQPDSATA